MGYLGSAESDILYHMCWQPSKQSHRKRLSDDNGLVRLFSALLLVRPCNIFQYTDSIKQTALTTETFSFRIGISQRLHNDFHGSNRQMDILHNGSRWLVLVMILMSIVGYAAGQIIGPSVRCSSTPRAFRIYIYVFEFLLFIVLSEFGLLGWLMVRLVTNSLRSDSSESLLALRRRAAIKVGWYSTQLPIF